MPDLYIAQKPLKPKPKTAPVSTSLLSPFIQRPANLHFEDQRKEETVLLLVRRHWVTNLSWLVAGFLFFFFPLLLVNFPAIAFLPGKFKTVVFIGWYLLLVAIIFEKFLTWYFNVGIITDQRVIDIDFYSLINKEISEAEMVKVQDVTQKQVGAISTVFDFGDIMIQTAGEKAKIEFDAIPHPAMVAQLLKELT